MLELSAPNKGHTMDIKAQMEKAFNLEDDFSADTITEFHVKNGKGFLVNRGPVEFSRGLIEAYVYIVLDNGETIAERLETPSEVVLWTEHLG